jgi:hypothetical protein
MKESAKHRAAFEMYYRQGPERTGGHDLAAEHRREPPAIAFAKSVPGGLDQPISSLTADRPLYST